MDVERPVYRPRALTVGSYLYNKAITARNKPTMVQYASSRGAFARQNKLIADNIMRNKNKRLRLTRPVRKRRGVYGAKSVYQRTRGYNGKFRRSKNYRLKGKARQIAQCVQIENEVGGIITDADCIYIGIASSPLDQMQRMIAYACVKCVANAAKRQFSDWNEPLAPNFTNGTINLEFQYYPDPTSIATTNRSSTGLSIAVNTTDNWAVKILTPTWTTNPTNWLPVGIISITT